MSELVNGNGTTPYVSIAYPEMLKNARKAKSERRDTFDWFLRNATNSGAYRMGLVIECRENVAGMSLLFLCMALIKFDGKIKPADEATEELKKHLAALKAMRTSTSVPLCVAPEEEGIMFPGEGMSLRFLNALIIFESLLLSKMTTDKENNVLKENWKMYSSLDLMISLQLPALLNVLDDDEKSALADKLENTDGYNEGSKERAMAAKLILSTAAGTQRARNEKEEDSKFGNNVLVLILFVMYTLAVIKLSHLVVNE